MNTDLRLSTEIQNAALGAFIGACVGDAAGATLEFIGRKPTDEEVDKAMTMPGGGVLQVAPGQITDDCELAICLARGLAGRSDFEIERIASKYMAWVDSQPFDIGFTTRVTLGCYIDPDLGCAESMRRSAIEKCMNSKANGSVMRVVPLGIWAHRFSIDEVAFVEAISETLAGGGDTDTNACIVGGVIGAADGFLAIPDSMSQPVLNCDTSTSHSRPDFLNRPRVGALPTSDASGNRRQRSQLCSQFLLSWSIRPGLYREHRSQSFRENDIP